MVSCLTEIASFLYPFDQEVTSVTHFGDNFACQQDRTQGEREKERKICKIVSGHLRRPFGRRNFKCHPNIHAELCIPISSNLMCIYLDNFKNICALT
jgi:hypothetical protein